MVTLIISDLHCPFEHRNALQHCLHMQKKYKTTSTIFIGDIADHHRISRFTSEPDSFGAMEEYEKTLKALRPWYKHFPKADIILGNHDLIPYRQVKEFGIPKVFLKDLNELYEIPRTWKFHDRLFRDKVLYLHSVSSGPTGTLNKSKELGVSVVCGHTHSFGGILCRGTPDNFYFALNVGCLIDKRAYAMRYSAKEITLGAGIVIDCHEAYFIPMSL